MKRSSETYSIKNMTRRLLNIGRPIRKYIAISASASVLGALSHMGLMGFGALWLLSAAGYTSGTLLYAVLTTCSALMIALCRYGEGVFSHIGAYGILAKMRVHLYDVIDKIAPAWLIDRETGDVMQIAVSDIETLEYFFAHTIGPILTVILLPLTTIILAWLVDPVFAGVLVPIYLIITVLLPLMALKAGREIGMCYREALGGLKSKILESIYGIRDLQIFGAEDQKTAEVFGANDQVNRASLGLTLHRQTIASLPELFVCLARILILACAGILALKGISDPVGTIALSFAATASLSSTFNLTFVVTSLLETYAAAERIFKIEDARPETVEPIHPQVCGEIEKIDFKDVCFTYPGRSEKVLDHFNLVIHKGEKIGIEGASGVGKSTVFRLLLRFYEPSSGEILINDIPIDRIGFDELYRRIALMEQDTYLFDANIAENISVAKEDAVSDEIHRAAHRAELTDLIDSLPEGDQTAMGQMSGRLSGGERQRIGMARIFLRNPDVCLLDEPSSALDALHEKELLHTLHTEYADKTIILISHRKSTLAGCDRVVKVSMPQAF